jgi:V/A-type H+-transporting ATPase subunit G/H
MELIKKIKQSEAQARQIIEQAKADVAKQAEQARKDRQQALAKAEQERKKTVEAAVAAAEKEALAEVEKLNAKAEKDRKQLRDNVKDKMAQAVGKVTDYVGSSSAKK